MTNLLDVFHVSLAYKSLALQLMLGEANWAVEQLELPSPRPLREQHVVASFVTPPGNLSGIRLGVRGTLDTSNHLFAFNQEGKLWSYIYRKYGPDTSVLEGEYAEKVLREPAIITTNDAYRMATNWLARIAVDVDGLNRSYHPKVWQQRRCDPPLTMEQLKALERWEDAPLVNTPIFYVAWGGSAAEFRLPKDLPARDKQKGVKVAILGNTRELLEIEMTETRFCLRPGLVITNAAELNSRPDPPIKAKALQSPNLTNGPPEKRQ